MKKVMVDTDVLIDYSKGKDKYLVKYLDSSEWELWVSPVNVTEFLNDKWLTTKFKQKKAMKFIDFFKCVEIGKKEGMKTGELIRSKQIDFLGDGLIAGSCLVNKMGLLTRNKKHFKKVKGLRLLG